MSIRFAPGARTDAVDLGDWFDARWPGSGTRFASALTDLLTRLVHHPRLYGRAGGAPRGREVRIALIGRFPAVVVYEVISVGGIVVLSLTHARTRKRPWRRRL